MEKMNYAILCGRDDDKIGLILLDKRRFDWWDGSWGRTTITKYTNDLKTEKPANHDDKTKLKNHLQNLENHIIP